MLAVNITYLFMSSSVPFCLSPVFSRFPPRFLLALCLGRMGSGAVMTGPI